MPASVDIEKLYRTHGPVVLRRARAILGNEADALEVLQEVFAGFVDRPDQLHNASSPMAFLYKATTHRCLNLLRNSRTRLRLLDLHAQSRERSEEQNPETRVLAQSLLAGLDETTAAAAVYYYIDEMSHAEAAELIGCSRRHVGNLLDRLRQSRATQDAAQC